MKSTGITRRSLLKQFALWAGASSLLGLILGPGMKHITLRRRVWQIDPDKCVNCGKCQSECVQVQSAVRCVHTYAICGYCDLCSGYYRQGASILDTAAERQLCPAGAIKRTFIEDPYFEYKIDESLCVGCGRCAKNCSAFGNGSLYLQIRHDLCSHCHQCAIAAVCPSKAISLVPAQTPYLLKGGA